jgi:TPR repeat protein
MVLLTLLFVPVLSQADYQAGLDAYHRADYARAMEEWQEVIAKPPQAVAPATFAETHYAIGMLHWQGFGVPKDLHQAYSWLKKAADLDHAGAQAKLGYLYAEGLVVEQSFDRAFSWFSKAAKQGDVDGQYNLGVFYLNGLGTEQNPTMAAQYLAAASAQGDADAEAALANLLPALNRKDAAIPAEPSSTEPKQAAPGSASPVEHQSQDSMHAADWILAQNPAHYTIQVIGLSSKAALEDLIEGHEYLAPFAYYVLQRRNRPLYLLLQGSYASVEAARRARDQFPPAIQKPKDVWIRQFDKVQALIIENKNNTG